MFEEEPLPAASPHWDAPGLLITPHTAGWSTDYADRIVHTLAENLRAFEEGRTPPGIVDRSLGY